MKDKTKKCLIPGCANQSGEGGFVGDFCSPCYNYVVGKNAGGPHNPSQAWKNEMVKSNFRFISSMRDKFYVGHEGDRKRLIVEVWRLLARVDVDVANVVLARFSKRISG
jgi:hypothetical protein